MPDGRGNEEQVRIVAEQIADTAITRFYQSNKPHKPEIPPPLKWAGIIISAVLVAVCTTGVLWLASSVNAVQMTLAEIKATMTVEAKLDQVQRENLERRLSQLEEVRK
jgi:hypothetical protein